MSISLLFFSAELYKGKRNLTATSNQTSFSHTPSFYSRGLSLVWSTRPQCSCLTSTNHLETSADESKLTGYPLLNFK